MVWGKKPDSDAFAAKARLGASISFGSEGNDANHLGIGWKEGAPGQRWAASGSSEIWLENPGPGDCFQLEIDVHATEADSEANPQSLTVALRGTTIGRSVIAGRRTLYFRIPGNLLAGQGPVRIQLQTNEIVLPPPYGDEIGQRSSVCFHALRLFQVPADGEMPGLEKPCSVSIAELEELSGMPAAQFFAQFESLGDNCEFGAVQRLCGAEPLGLLRFGSPRLHHVLECLQTGFAHFGAPENIRIILVDTTREYNVQETRYESTYHTWYYEGDVDQNVLLKKQIQRFGFLKRKLLEDLSEGQKIFVCKCTERLVTLPEIVALHDTLCEFAGNTLLWVTLADQEHSPGSVEMIRPGLLIAYILHFSPIQNVPDVDLESWLAICVNAYRLIQSAPSRPERIERKRELPPIAPPAAPDLPPNATLPLLAHVQNVGDTYSDPDGWAGRSGSGLAVEGFVVLEDAVLPTRGLSYQAVFQDASLSLKAGIGEYCGTRGENLPIYGLLVSLDASVSPAPSLACEARFTDGTEAKGVPAGEICKAESGATLEAFRIRLLERSGR